MLDEASQVGTRDLAALLTIVRAGGARLVMVGDTAQLGAVEAGGMMRLIAAGPGHWELAEVHRFYAEWEALASLQLRQGARAALRAYDMRGRIRGSHQARPSRTRSRCTWPTICWTGIPCCWPGRTRKRPSWPAWSAQLARLGRVPQRPEVTLADGNAAAARGPGAGPGEHPGRGRGRAGADQPGHAPPGGRDARGRGPGGRSCAASCPAAAGPGTSRSRSSTEGVGRAGLCGQRVRGPRPHGRYRPRVRVSDR